MSIDTLFYRAFKSPYHGRIPQRKSLAKTKVEHMLKLGTTGRSRLMETALGEAEPDAVITGGEIVDVFTGSIRSGDVLIRDGRIAAIADPGMRDPGAARVFDVSGRYLVPGMIDPHMHMESSSVVPSEFARAVMPRGVSTVVVDPHEFGNVVGVNGIRAFLDACKGLPLRVLLRVPARVPELSNDLETGGAIIDENATRDMLGWPETVCLAGDINPEIILRRDPGQMTRMQDTLDAGHVISGYVPQLDNAGIDAMVAAGVRDTHVPKDLAEIRRDLEHGLFCLLTPRPGRFEEADFRDLARAVTNGDLDCRRICLCTDDVLVHELLEDGHLDSRLRMAIRAGMPPVTAIQMATLNTATLLRIDDHVGAIAAGRFADIAVVEDLSNFSVSQMFASGVPVESEAPCAQRASAPLPDFVRKTIHCATPDLAALQVTSPTDQPTQRCRVLVNSQPKELEEHDLPVRDGIVLPDPAAGIMSLAVVERYHRSGRVGRGFVRGFGLKHGAVASSTNHNSHHIFALGCNAADMRLALDRLIELQGGYIAVKDGKVIAELPLPVIGMISEAPMEDLARDMTSFDTVLREDLGCEVSRRPIYALNFLCSPVVMGYGVSDLGLINSRKLELVDLFVDN